MASTRQDSVQAPPVRKDLSIQALRGAAVILMVAGHVIGSASSRGMNVPDDSLWRYLYLLLEDIRMPLFTVISGYVYAIRPVRGTGDVNKLVSGKARRLILPLLTVGALLFGMQLLVPGTNATPAVSDFWRVYVFGYDHLWFLQSIFIIFVIVGILDGFGQLSNRRRWMLYIGLSLVSFLLVRVPGDYDIFSVNGALRLLPFFLLGYGIKRFDILSLAGRQAFFTFALFLLVYSLRVAEVLGSWEPGVISERALSLAVGITGIVLIYSLRRWISWRWLGWVGGFSFGIYLLHVFASAACRILLEKLGISVDPVIFALGLVAGVGGPIVFQLMFGRWRLIRTCVLGEKSST